MIRRLILRPPRSILLPGVVAVILPTPAARAQDRAMQDRLDRLERDLSMLQRQVYRGGACPGRSALGRRSAVDTEIRMDGWKPRCAN